MYVQLSISVCLLYIHSSIVALACIPPASASYAETHTGPVIDNLMFFPGDRPSPWYLCHFWGFKYIYDVPHINLCLVYVKRKYSFLKSKEKTEIYSIFSSNLCLSNDFLCNICIIYVSIYVPGNGGLESGEPCSSNHPYLALPSPPG